MSLLSELKRIDDLHDAREITQEQHDRMSAQAVKKYQPKEDKNTKKICLIAIILALVGIGLASSITTNNNVFEIEINNTNLAPTVAGEINGTGERVQGITYYANNTPIELFVWGHALSAGSTAELHLFINGTKVSDTSGRPIGVAEQSNKTITAIIPRYASYMVEITNTHHYEWREYRIISG